MTKWCGDLWGLGEVVGRRCSALLVLGLGEVRWWEGAVAHYGCRALGEEVVGRRCSALLVLRREGGWGFSECSEVL